MQKSVIQLVDFFRAVSLRLLSFCLILRCAKAAVHQVVSSGLSVCPPVTWFVHLAVCPSVSLRTLGATVGLSDLVLCFTFEMKTKAQIDVGFVIIFDRSALRRPRTNSEDALDGPLEDDDGGMTSKSTKMSTRKEDGVENAGSGGGVGDAAGVGGVGALARYNSMGTLLTPKDTEEFVETLQVRRN